MNNTPDSSKASRLVAYGDRLFSQGADCLRQSRAALANGDRHSALKLQKLAFGAFEGADCCYARGYAVTGPRQERRRRVIRAVVRVNIHDLVPRPLPGEGGEADRTHAFKTAELLRRGRKAVRRHQLTRAVNRRVAPADMNRVILDADGIWKDSVGRVVQAERRWIAYVWRSFVASASHCVAGWRCDELLGELPGILAGQTRTLDAAFLSALPSAEATSV